MICAGLGRELLRRNSCASARNERSIRFDSESPGNRAILLRLTPLPLKTGIAVAAKPSPDGLGCSLQDEQLAVHGASVLKNWYENNDVTGSKIPDSHGVDKIEATESPLVGV